MGVDNMQCKNCGAEVKDTAKFCSECGAKLSEILAPDTKRENENASDIKKENNERPQSESPKMKFISITILAGLAIIFLLVLVFALAGRNSPSEVNTSDYKQYATDAVISWYSIDEYARDEYNVYTPYLENGFLYIPIEAQINSAKPVQYRGFGTASITDTYDKTVPFQYEYEQSTVTRGEYQSLLLRIPVTDLDVQKPTTLYLQSAVYVNGKQDLIKLNFAISW